MGTYLNPGSSGFVGIRNDKYVDKTGMISLINDTIDTPRKLTCISRPRRFGKSFAAKMLCAYYDKTCDSSALFDDLEIAQDPSYHKHMNRYDVIYLDMTNIIGKTSPDRVILFIESGVTEELLKAYPGLSRGNSFDETLLHAAERAGGRFIFIIDEWDAPIRETPQIVDEYLRFLRMIFKSSGTTDKIVAAAYMTGILPIKKDGSQSAVSDFKEYTVLGPGRFAVYYGFTEAEVEVLCREYGMDFEKAREWYDGYSFAAVTHIYNPYSVMCAMQDAKFQSYWKKTSAAEALLTYIDMDEDGLQEDIAGLISGEKIEVDTGGFENDFSTFKDKEDVLTLMIHLGYLAYEEEEDGIGLARIPNEEVRREFNKILRKGRHQTLIRLVRDSDSLLKKTIQMDEKAVAEALEKIHDSITAPRFYNDEQALRSVIRMAYISCVDQYIRIEELPSGHGYADVVFVPKRRSALPAMIVELKWNQTAKGAIAQITDRNYPVALKDYGGELLLIGVNYDKETKVHTCCIRKHEEQVSVRRHLKS